MKKAIFFFVLHEELKTEENAKPNPNQGGGLNTNDAISTSVFKMN